MLRGGLDPCVGNDDGYFYFLFVIFFRVLWRVRVCTCQVRHGNEKIHLNGRRDQLALNP